MGDTAASDFKGIEFLNCFEYTLWQLMRQNGISDYRAALNTTAFITDPRALTTQFYGRVAKNNFIVLKTNLKRFYGVTPVSYENCIKNDYNTAVNHCGSDIHQFIRKAIQNGYFVYTLYNHFYDTINDTEKSRRKNLYHSTILTGFDDSRKQYIALIDGRYNIGYCDLEHMYGHFERRAPWISPWIVFHLSPIQDKSEESNTFREELYLDLEKTVLDWKKESEIFGIAVQKMLTDYDKSAGTLSYERAHQLYRLMILLYWMRLGCHGNLYLKLKALSDITGCYIDNFYNKFAKNRRKSENVANIIGRVYVSYSYERLVSAAGKIKEMFVDEAKLLRNELKQLIEDSKRGG